MSTAVFMYAIWTSHQRRVIYIQGSTTTGFKILYGSAGHFLVSSTIDGSSAEVVRLWVKRNVHKGDLVVVDDTHTAFIEAIIFYCIQAKARLIVSTSYQAIQVSSELQDIAPTSGYTMESWSYNEYTDATIKGVLPFTIDKLDEMYYYAGGSIRYMYWPIDRIVTYFDLYIRLVTDARALLRRHLGDRTMTHINTLMSITKGDDTNDSNGVYDIYSIQSTIISEYVTKALRIHSLDLDTFLNAAREVAHTTANYNSNISSNKNKRQQQQQQHVRYEWLTALALISKVRALRVGNSLTMSTMQGEQISYALRNTICNVPINGIIPPKHILPGTFYIPKYNYACFDLAHLDLLLPDTHPFTRVSHGPLKEGVDDVDDHRLVVYTV